MSVPDATIIKVLVLGASNAGKTSLITRYCLGKWSANRVSTIGVDFMSRNIALAAGMPPVVLQVWDTAGQERFTGGSISAPFYRKADGVILVYDVTSMASAEQLSKWHAECVAVLGQMKPVIVLGNKCDCLPPPPHTLPEAELCRKILSVQEYVRLWAGEQGYMHLECSAKNDTGVEAAMMAMVASALEDVKRPRNHCNNQAEADNAGTNRAPAGSGRGSRAPAHARGSLAIDDLFAPEHSAGTCCR